MIGRRLGHYEIVARVGEGGMGVVYKARDTHLDRFAAIKVLPADWVADRQRKQRFVQEAKAASALNHPGIVTIYDISQADGVDFIAMEFVQGKTLQDLLGRKGLSLKDTLNYAAQAAAALAKAHEAGIVHRDLKPSNIMVGDDGRVRILDFGVAKLLARENEIEQEAETQMAAPDPLRTAAGTTVGTLAYMSPEQAEGGKVDARSDIFSFGAVLYEMITGARAFQGATAALTRAAVVSGEPTAPSTLGKEVPRDLERLILRCLRKDPSRRFQVASDVAVELEEIKTDSGTQIAAVAPARRRRSLWWAGGAAALLLAAVAGGWLWFRPKAPASVPQADVVQLTTVRGDERTPTFNPDSTQIAFSWNGEQGSNSDIYVMPIGSGTPVQMTTDPAVDLSPAWSPDGRQIAFLRREAATFGVYVMTPPVRDSEHKVADLGLLNLVGQGSFPTVSWLPKSQALLASSRRPDAATNGIVLIWLDGREQSQVRLIDGPAVDGNYLYPTVSPAGQFLAYARCVSALACEIFVSDFDQNFTVGTPQPVTNRKSVVRGIAWLTDGQSLLYSAGTQLEAFLWRAPIGGTAQRVEAGNDASYPTVSANGLVAYERISREADIWRLRPHHDGLEDYLHTSLNLRPQFSPDGKKLVFESQRMGRYQLWLANADGTNPAPINDGDTELEGSPRWSPTSDRIAFDAIFPNGQRGVYVVNAAIGAQRRPVTVPGSLPSWSGDGKDIYFSGRTGSPGIWRVPADGGTPTQVTRRGNNALASPNGQTLFYLTGSAAGFTLISRPIAGETEEALLETTLGGAGSSYFPVGKGIYYVTRPDGQASFNHELRFFSFATRKTETLTRFEARFGGGLTVSPDEQTILYSGSKPSAGNDLMLIQNFR